MNDVQRDKIINNAANIYIVCLLVILFSVFLPDKTYGLVLFVILLPISTVAYFLVYRVNARQYQDETKKLIAFSTYGDGKKAGILYSVSKAFIVGIVVLFGCYLFKQLI